VKILYEDKHGNILMEDDVAKLPQEKIEELGLHPSGIDDGELAD